MRFKYKAFSKQGREVVDTVIADDINQAQARIKSRGLEVETIKHDRMGMLQNLFRANIGGVSFRDKVVFTRNLSVMTKAGISLDEALNILSQETTNPRLKFILSRVRDGIQSGATFSESLREYPKVFDEIYVNIIASAEQGGTLEKSLNQLAVQLTKSYELRGKIRNALFYPAVIVVSTFVVAILLSVFVLPKITALFASFHTQLPLTTRVLIAFSGAVTTQPLLLLLALVSLVVAILVFTRSKFFRPLYHRLVLRVPIFGRIARFYNLGLFSRTLFTTLASGVPIDKSLSVTSQTLRNVRYRQALTEVVQDQTTGESLGDLLQQYEKLFPPIVHRMIRIGEESGDLEDVLQFLADFYEQEIDNMAKNLTAILEPVLLVVIGGVVLTVALAIITPIYQITGSFQF